MVQEAFPKELVGKSTEVYWPLELRYMGENPSIVNENPIEELKSFKKFKNSSGDQSEYQVQ